MTALTIGLGRELVERLGWCLVHSVWQLAAVGLIAAIVLRGLRRGSAQARYLAACGALAAMTVLPAWTFATIRIPSDAELKASVAASPWTPDGRSKASESPPAPEDPRQLPGDDPSVVSLGDSRRPSAETWDETFRPWLPRLVVVWGVVVFGLSLRLVGGWLCIQWLVRHRTRSAPERWIGILHRLKGRLGMRSAVRLLESARVHVPMAVGWLRPAILLPVTILTELPSDQLEAILAHELAHIRRYDYLVNLIQSVVETLLFYHPAVWWISGRIRVEREHCCDDWAVEACGDRVLYARALAALEEQRGSGWRLAASARDGSLLGRVRRLLGVPAPAERSASGLAGTLAMAVVVLFTLTLFLAPTTNQAEAAVEDAQAITGVVITPDDTLVAGADVWLVANSLADRKGLTLAKGRTDEEGRFRLASDRLKMRPSSWVGVWIHKPGQGVAWLESRDPASLVGRGWERPLRLTLGVPATSTFRVNDPQGKPVAGARVAVIFLKPIAIYMPDDLSDRLSVQTDASGLASLGVGPAGLIRLMRVTTELYGVQNYQDHEGFPAGATLALQSVVPLEGRVTAADPAAVKRLKVHVTCTPEKRLRGKNWGEAEALTDDEGHFSVAQMVPGRLSAASRAAPEFPVPTRPDRRPQLRGSEPHTCGHCTQTDGPRPWYGPRERAGYTDPGRPRQHQFARVHAGIPGCCDGRLRTIRDARTSFTTVRLLSRRAGRLRESHIRHPGERWIPGWAGAPTNRTRPRCDAPRLSG